MTVFEKTVNEFLYLQRLDHLQAVYKHTFLGLTGTCSSIPQFLNKSCIKPPVQQPAATITAFLLCSVFLKV